MFPQHTQASANVPSGALKQAYVDPFAQITSNQRFYNGAHGNQNPFASGSHNQNPFASPQGNENPFLSPQKSSMRGSRLPFSPKLAAVGKDLLPKMRARALGKDSNANKLEIKE